MKYIRNFCRVSGISLGMLLACRLQGGVNVSSLVSFNNTNGANPVSGLVEDADGTLYGTTYVGGPSDLGTIYRVTIDGALTNLVSFNGTNGSNPYAGLVKGTNGSYYGATEMGGANGGYGTVFKIGAVGFTSLFSFNNTNGAFPEGSLVLGADGNFYGTTAAGGTNGGFGTVFKITHAGVLSVLFSFNSNNGAAPYGALVQGGDGSFYGTTTTGGTNGGMGTVFRITSAGTMTHLISFNGTNGANPYAALVTASDGNFYSTTSAGGSSGLGTVFRISTNGAIATLAAFNSTNGANPYSALVSGSDGRLYGTTQLGGSNNDGTTFAITLSGSLSPLASFDFFTTGNLLRSALVQAKDGNFYGTTYGGGGPGKKGGVFRLSVPLQPVLISSPPSGGSLQLHWNSVVGQVYQLKYLGDPTQTNWLDLGTPILATNTTVTVSDSVPIGPAKRFYRVVVLP